MKKIIELVEQRVKEKSLTVIRYRPYVKSSDVLLTYAVTEYNVLQIVDYEFSSDLELKKRIFPYVEYDELSELAQKFKELENIDSPRELLTQALITNEKLLKTSQAFQCYSLLKKTISKGDFELIENQFFQSVVKPPQKVLTQPCQYMIINKGRLIQNLHGTAQDIEKVFLGFIDTIGLDIEIKELIEIDKIQPLPENAKSFHKKEDMELFFINPKSEKKLNIFIETVLDYFPKIYEEYIISFKNRKNIEEDFKEMLKKTIHHHEMESVIEIKNNRFQLKSKI